MSKAKTEWVIEWLINEVSGEEMAVYGKYRFIINPLMDDEVLVDVFDESTYPPRLIVEEDVDSVEEARRLCSEFISELPDKEHMQIIMSETQCSNREFMQGCGQVVRDTPGDPGAESRLIQFKIIFEEVQELADAIAVDAYLDDETCRTIYEPSVLTDEVLLRQSPVQEFNLTETADALADIVYTCIGMANACGIALKPILAEVCENNLLKLKTGTMNKAGKLVKHPEHSKPDIEGLLRVQGWEGE